jgi:phospholipase A-2-activating protein
MANIFQKWKNVVLAKILASPHFCTFDTPNTMQADWNLSQSFTADGAGIRCAAVLPPLGNENEATAVVDKYRVVVGNQAGGLLQFGVPSGALSVIPHQHDDAVTALLASASRRRCDGQYYVTGCKDGVVRFLDGATHTLLAASCRNSSHAKPVTSLAWADVKERWLVSGSWDGTAKIWCTATHSLVATLPNHENSVCVASLGDIHGDMLTIATGSAGAAANGVVVGHSTRIWQVNVVTGEATLQCTVANDHDGPIRDIVTLPMSQPAMIATCSNDGTVKIRDAATGTTVSTLVFMHSHQQHPPMLLSIAAGDSFLAAGAEDGHLIVWDLDEEGAVAGSNGGAQTIRHAECIWSVIPLPDNDLATACQDGTLRIFTRATERVAPTDEQAAFVANTEQALLASRNGPTAQEVAKLHPWELNGQKRGTSEGQIHLFNKGGIAIAAQWSSESQTWIEVGEVTGKADGGVLDGVHYDHVFPIEVDQAGGGLSQLQIGYNTGENPFNAAQRFIDTHMLSQHYLSEIANYITQRTGQQPPVLGATQPSSGPMATAMAGTPIASYQYLPAKGYKVFELPEKNGATTLEKMKQKIVEFGGSTDVTLLASLMATLLATNRYHASTVSTPELQAVSDLLEQFSASRAFPALDLARLAVLHPDAASSQRCMYWNLVLRRAVALCRTTDPLDGGPAAVAVPMLSLRLFGNAFKGGSGSRDAVVSLLDSILECAAHFVQSDNKNVRLSVVTVVYNACVYAHQQKTGDALALQIVPILHDILSSKSYEAEAVFRALVALGTIVMESPLAKEAAVGLFLASKVEPAASPHGEQAKSAAKEVYSLLA